MTGKNIVIFLTLLTLTIAEEIATENTIAEDVGDASGVVRVCVTWCEYVYLSLLISCQYRIGQDLYGRTDGISAYSHSFIKFSSHHPVSALASNQGQPDAMEAMMAKLSASTTSEKDQALLKDMLANMNAERAKLQEQQEALAKLTAEQESKLAGAEGGLAHRHEYEH